MDMLGNMKDVLVVAAHPDDELLGSAATVRRLADSGATVRAVIMAEGLTSRSDTREESDLSELANLQKDARSAARIAGYSSIEFCALPDNRMDSLDLLDVVKKVTSYVDRYRPDTVLTHHHGDLNIDHRITCEAVLTACRPTGGCCVRRILAFETPSSTEWDFEYAKPFCPNVFVDVSETLEAKIQAMLQYRSESTRAPHPRSPESLRALAAYRGSSAGFDFAEAFMLLRAML